MSSSEGVAAGAVQAARAAAAELGPVGEHLGAEAGVDQVTHRFVSGLRGYRGWQWSVVLAAPPGAEHATVSEVVLLPGPDALVAPEWLPWEERVRPGDLGAGDLLPPPAQDPRLVPGYVGSGDPAVEELALEVGLGRRQVMSREGRLDAAERWFGGEHGPGAEVARAVELHCGTCGFYLPVAGSLRAAFGVCGNEFAADGRVVHAGYGCGAHSDTVVAQLAAVPVSELTHDGLSLDVTVNEVPVNEVPVNEVPVNEVAANEVPVNEVPVSEVPVGEVPAGEVPEAVVPEPAPDGV